MERWESVRGILLRPLPWALFFVGLIAYGAYALLHIPVEVLPRFHFPQISVVTHYPGATASELETLIARPLEGQILGLQDLVSVRSSMGNGTVQIDIRFSRESDPQGPSGGQWRDRPCTREPSGGGPPLRGNHGERHK